MLVTTDTLIRQEDMEEVKISTSEDGNHVHLRFVLMSGIIQFDMTKAEAELLVTKIVEVMQELTEKRGGD